VVPNLLRLRANYFLKNGERAIFLEKKTKTGGTGWAVAEDFPSHPPLEDFPSHPSLEEVIIINQKMAQVRIINNNWYNNIIGKFVENLFFILWI